MSTSGVVYPLLLADIGGTNVRLALKDGPADDIRAHRTLATADFATLDEAIAAWLPAGVRPGHAALAVAAPILPGPIRLTNTDFVIDGDAVRRRFGLAGVRLMNDFEAQAWSLPTLSAADLSVLGPVAPNGQGTMAVIGPGTGLGCAGLLRLGERWLPLPGEGGHVTLSAQSDLEAAVIARARRDHDHVSAERLVSGTGLPVLYRCLADVLGDPPDPAVDEGAEISEAADRDPLAAATLDLFGALLGGFAGNVALTLGARGGVWIAGGIAPRLVDRLSASPFRDRFEQKGRFQSYLKDIGTAIVMRPDPALAGLAFAMEQG